jgi:type VI secretion system secreted protein VgrG
MSLIESLKSPFLSHNRYQLAIQGCDALLDVESFIGREAISKTYRYQITFTSPAQNLQANSFFVIIYQSIFMILMPF